MDPATISAMVSWKLSVKERSEAIEGVDYVLLVFFDLKLLRYSRKFNLNACMFVTKSATEQVVTYSCNDAPSYTRTVQIRNAIDLVGSYSLVIPAGIEGW